MNGYGALRESAAWIDLSARGKICVNGDDRARLLHAITTNHIQELTPGCYVFFLNAQGRALADPNILCREDHLLLDTEPEIPERIYAHLDHHVIADDVTLEDTAARTTTLAVEGLRSAEVLARIGPPVPEADYAFVPWGSRLVARLSSTGSPGFFVFGPVGEQPALIAQLGIEQADAEAARIVRLEYGKPRYGEDITGHFLAQETNQSHALHFSKGCYLGQEIVERVCARAQLHRRLMPWTSTAPRAQLPEPGSPPKATPLPKLHPLHFRLRSQKSLPALTFARPDGQKPCGWGQHMTIAKSAVLMAAAAVLSTSTLAQLPPSRVLTLDAAARDGESHG
jgi:tRNA-modifying protein YgfZ